MFQNPSSRLLAKPSAATMNHNSNYLASGNIGHFKVDASSSFDAYPEAPVVMQVDCSEVGRLLVKNVSYYVCPTDTSLSTVSGIANGIQKYTSKLAYPNVVPDYRVAQKYA
jgi:hypothetical protein